MNPQIDLLTPILDRAESKWSGTLAALRSHLRSLKRDCTADDAHDYLDSHGICLNGDRRWLGALWHGWQHVGYRKSERPECHYRVVSVWRWMARLTEPMKSGESALDAEHETHTL